MKKVILLLMLCLGQLFVAGCQEAAKNKKNSFTENRKIPEFFVGTWKAEKFAWQFTVSQEGKVESAIFPMGEAVVKPNKTTYIEMRDGSKSSYKSGNFPFSYDEKTRQLEVTIELKKIHIKYLNNQIKGTNKTEFVGVVSKDGAKWEGFKIEEFDYGPRFPQAAVAPEPITFVKINN